MPEGFMTVAEAAKAKGVSVQTVRRWCDDGWIDGASKHGRDWAVPRASVMAFKPPKPGRKPKPTDEGTDDDR